MQILNTTQFRETQDLLGDGFDEFLAVFIQELTNAITKLSTGSDNNHLISHSQKSSCALLGAESLSDIFRQIEEQAKNVEDISALVELLPNELEKLKSELNNC
jgi:HPt (histidine-containing phosphotransfer) domain-containing protein